MTQCQQSAEKGSKNAERRCVLTASRKTSRTVSGVWWQRRIFVCAKTPSIEVRGAAATLQSCFPYAGFYSNPLKKGNSIGTANSVTLFDNGLPTANKDCAAE